jgi:hypothetical protein
MSLLRWIWAYLFDCVHSRTTWPHQNQIGLAYVCCLDCGREMPYSLESMQIIGQDCKPNIWDSRSPATAPLIIAGALLLLTPSYAVAQTAYFSADQSQTACGDDNIAPTLAIDFVGGLHIRDDLRHSEVQLAGRLQETYGSRASVDVFRNWPMSSPLRYFPRQGRGSQVRMHPALDC